MSRHVSNLLHDFLNLFRRKCGMCGKRPAMSREIPVCEACHMEIVRLTACEICTEEQ